MEQVEKTLNLICETIDNNTSREIVIVDVRKMTTVADYFIICTGKSGTQVRTLAENVEQQLEDAGIDALRTEGINDGRWAILDYGNIIVHFFLDETRLFFCLDELWSDGTNVKKYVRK